jgi:hypothetical protein
LSKYPDELQQWFLLIFRLAERLLKKVEAVLPRKIR